MSSEKTGGQAEPASELLADNQNEPLLADFFDGSEQKPIFPADASLRFADGDGQDTLDLADILTGRPGSENIDDYLMAIDNGGSSTLLVDADGSGNFTNPDLVLEIDGVNWDSGTAGQIADLVSDAVIIVV